MEIFENHSLKTFNTFGVEVTCDYFVELSSKAALKRVLTLPTPKLILGGGSNILFTKHFSGTVIHNQLRGITLLEEGAEHYLVEVASGENWHQFVEYSLQKGWYGLEYLALIPGTVGAAPVQNIGAYGVEVGDLIDSVLLFDLERGSELRLYVDELELDYRDSLFKRNLGRYFIISVRFKLLKKGLNQLNYGALEAWFDAHPQEIITPQTIAKAVIEIRRAKLPDPRVIGNAGSFFQNPVIKEQQFQQLIKQYPQLIHYPVGSGWVKLAAGQLIELAGFKGQSQGAAGTYSKQALILVNLGGASGRELLNYAQKIANHVEELFGVMLIPEPVIL